jgi:hypothetical protein
MIGLCYDRMPSLPNLPHVTALKDTRAPEGVSIFTFARQLTPAVYTQDTGLTNQRLQFDAHRLPILEPL